MSGGGRRIAWLLYGSIEERTGGTIYDRIVIEGLRARGFEIDVVDPRGSRNAIMRRLLAVDVLVGDELCFREIADVFPHAATREVARAARAPPHVLGGGAAARGARAGACSRVEGATRSRRHHNDEPRDARTAREREGARRHIEVVRPGADRLAVACAVRDEEAVRFVFVGAVVARKRVRVLVLALPAGATLRVIGSIGREKRYAELVRALAAARSAEGVVVELLGEVDDATLARELAAADALVMPSSLEGYGIAATEAIHAGVPVIAARTPGLEEALAPCPDAVLFARTDSDGFARVLHRFSTDDALKTQMRAAASTVVLPTWAETVAGFAAALQSAIDVPRT